MLLCFHYFVLNESAYAFSSAEKTALSVTNQWYHLAVTRNSSNGTVKIYKDAVLLIERTSMPNSALVIDGLLFGSH